jgi:hypothetical protein
MHGAMPVTYVEWLYIQLDGYYRIVYSNGNVSLKLNEDEVRQHNDTLAKNAGLEKVIKLA